MPWQKHLYSVQKDYHTIISKDSAVYVKKFLCLGARKLTFNLKGGVIDRIDEILHRIVESMLGNTEQLQILF